MTVKEYCGKRFDEEKTKFWDSKLHEEKVVHMAKMEVFREIFELIRKGEIK